MRDAVAVALLVPLAYLLGTFPSAAIVARRKGVDITAEGSGNPGASNTFRLLGWKWGVLVFALDAAKGAIAAAVGLVVADGHVGAYVLGIAAIVGHMFPVMRHFKGGRGVATGAGVLLVIFPLLTLGSTVLWFAIVRLTHKASLASVTVVIAFPIAVAVAGHPWGDVTVIAAVAVLVVARHAANLKRLWRGEELGLDPGGRDGADG
ncbi:MAG TPA: glycerol-3-phosphate 1-O-acyltransferase PlsY [Acidimicrobiia bacterium]|jgi:glycerol-3-phosphate acyltransferase PlsY